jgi:tRNA-2-methylthio-N6-dimethylallyladenosine synthase
MNDDVHEEVKTKRLMEIIELQNHISLEKNNLMIGKVQEILIEGRSKKSDQMLTGRTDGNKSVIISKNGYRQGEKVMVKITRVNSATLFGEPVG